MRTPRIALSVVCILSMNWLFADFTWTGGSGTNWSTPANWGGTAPSGTGVTLNFPSPAAGTSTDDILSGLSIGTMSIFSTGTSYTIEGSSGNLIQMIDGSAINISVNDPSQGGPTLNYLNLLGNTTVNMTNTAVPPTATTASFSNVKGSGSLSVTALRDAQDNYTFMLTAPNSYMNTVLSGIIIEFGSNDAFPQGATAAVNLTNSSVLALLGTNQTIPILNVDSSSFVTNKASMTPSILTVGSGTIAGQIKFDTGDSTLSLVKTGTGTLTLSGTNTYTGGTTLSGGILSIESSANLGSGTITGDGGTLQLTNSFSMSPTISLNVSTTTTIETSASSATLGGLITGNGTLQIAGTGTIILTHANNYLDGTIISGGTLSISSESNINAGVSGDLVTLAGGTLHTTNTVTIGPLVPFFVTANSAIISDVSTTIPGTLTATGGATLSLSGAGINSIGTVAVNSGTFTIAGPISGSQALNKTGGGTLTLTGGNVYTAETTISAGTLALLGTGSLPSTGAVSVNGIFDISQVTTGTNTTIGELFGPGNVVLGANNLTATIAGTDSLSGTVSGVGGSFTKQGAGTITFSGPNTYSGGTTISGGTLALLGGGSLFSTGAVVVNGTFDISQITPSTITIGDLTGVGTINLGTKNLTVGTANNTSFSGTIGGIGGSFTKAGSGKLSLTGNGTYTSGTFIDNGILQISNPANIADSGVSAFLGFNGGTLQITAGMTLIESIELLGAGTIDTNGSNLIVSGGFTGVGSLTKIGAGKLSVTGATNSVGSVLISAGELAILDVGMSVTSLTAATVTVSNGATLSGTGVIHGDVTNNGTMAPGSSPGTFTINGSYIDDLTFKEAITPTLHSELIVTGAVTINPGTTFELAPDVSFTASAYKSGPQSFVVITSGAPVVGTYSTFTSLYPLLVTGFLTYNQGGDNVVLNLTGPLSLASLILTGNPGKVAVALDTLLAADNPVANAILSTLVLFDQQQIYNALDRMHPALYKGMAVAQENNVVQVRDTVSQRFQTLLDERRCFVCENEENRRNVHVWATGIGDFLSQDSNNWYKTPQVGYQDNTSGVVVGGDYRFLDYFFIGTLGAYTHSSLNWVKNRGHGDVSSGYVGLYLSAIDDLFYGNLSFVGGWSHYDAHRNIIYPGVDTTAKSNHAGSQLITHIDTGLNFEWLGVTIRPFDSLDWIIQNEHSYSETGGGIYDLKVSNMWANMLRNELGVNFAACGYPSRAKMILDTKFSWVREVRMEGKDSRSEFVGTDVPFTVIGYMPNRNLFSCGATLTTVLLQGLTTCSNYKDGMLVDKFVTRQDRLSFTVYYNGVFGSGYSDNSVGGQLNCAF